MPTFNFKFDNRQYTVVYTDSPIPIPIPEGSVVGLDIETYKIGVPSPSKRVPKPGLAPHITGVRLVQLYDGVGTIYVMDCLSMTPPKRAWLKQVLSKYKFIAHNAVFDQMHLRDYNDALDIECTMIKSQLLETAEVSQFGEWLKDNDDGTVYTFDEDEEDDADEERYAFTGHGLKACVERHLKVAVLKDHQDSDWNNPKLTKHQLIYASLDSVLTYRLNTQLDKELRKHDMRRAVTLSASLMVPVIAEMTATGLPINTDKHALLVSQWEKQRADALSETDKYFSGINLNSTKQLNTWITDNVPAVVLATWPRTPSGKYSLNRKALAPYMGNTAIKAYVGYKKVHKLLNTYGKSFLEYINPASKRLHTSFTIGKTRTGRLSSVSPNLQNAPRLKEFRSIFESDHPATSLVVYDLSQIEIRVAAELSRDPVMLDAFATGKDLHRVIASRMINVPVDQVTDEQRKKAKGVAFGLQFGMRPKKLQSYLLSEFGIKVTLEESQSLFDMYYDLFKIYIQYADLRRNDAKSDGYVATPLGKRRKLHPQEVFTKAINTPIQGGACEVLMYAMVWLFKEIRKKGWKEHITIMSTVHDEVILEAVEGYERKAAKLLQKAFEVGMTKLFPTASIHNLSEGGIGKNWGTIVKF